MLKRISLAAAFLAACLSLPAQSRIEVSSTGQLKAAVDQARTLPGDDTVRIFLHGGTYFLDTPLRLTGEDKHPMVFEGDPSDMPVLSAGVMLKGWSKTSEGWWKCSVPEAASYGWEFEQLYVNDVRAVRARTPDDGFFIVKATEENVLSKGEGRAPEYSAQTIFADPDNLKSLKGLTPAELNEAVVVFYHKWDNTRRHIGYALPDSGKIFFSGPAMKPWNPLTSGTTFILENYKAAMNAPGEWFLDKDGTLYYIPRKGEDLASAVCFAPVLNHILLLEGTAAAPVEGKIFRNISFQHAAYRMPSAGYNPNQVAADVDAAVEMEYARNIKLENCEIRHTGNYALWLRRGCEGNLVRHCYLQDLGAGGIKVGETAIPSQVADSTGNTLIDNNIVTHIGRNFPCAGGIVIFQSGHNKVLHNEVSDCNYTGISVGWVWGYSFSPAIDNEVAFNHIHDIGQGELSDMGAVYTLGISPGTTVHDNVIHDVSSYDYGGWGLYTDEGSTGIVLENNLVYGCKCGGFHQHYGENNVIRNNIFGFGTLQQLQFTRVEDHRSFTFEHNIIVFDGGEPMSGPWDKGIIDMDWNCWWNIKGETPMFLGRSFSGWRKFKEPHSIFADPLFKDAAGRDFRFRKTSVARKIGFKPFDYSQAGVYGDASWKEKARK